MIPVVMERLAAEGRRVQAGGNRPFLLDEGRAWLVRAGRVDVFTVAVRDGAPAGARSHLFRVESGALLLGGRARGVDLALLGVGAPGTELVELDLAELRRLAAEPTLSAPLGEMVDAWVEALCAGVSGGVAPGDCVELPAATPAQPAEASRVRPPGRVSWVRHDEGASMLFGRPELRVNGTGFTPLSGRTWMQVGPGASIRALPTGELVGQDEMWAGLETLYALVLACAAQNAATAAAAERNRLRAKARASRGAFSNAVAALASPLASGAAPGAPEPAAAGDPGDGLLAVCRRVGEALGLPVHPLPRSADERRARDPLGALARANRIRVRQVMLRDGWWSQDAGPLVARRAEGGAPVALLPVAGPAYDLWDPSTGRAERVTGEVADALAPAAHTFYRPFPDHVLRMGDLMRFGLRGSRRDVLTVVGMGVAGGLLSLVTPIATGIIFNDVIPGAARSQLAQMTAVLLVIAVASALFTLCSGIALVRLEGKMGSAVQAAVWDRILSLPMTFFRPYTAGNLATRAMGIDAIRQVLSGATVSALLSGLFSVFHFALLFRYSPRLAMWASLMIGIAIAATVVAGRLQTRAERAASAMQARLAGWVLQMLTSVGKLRVAGAEGHAFALWAHSFGEQRQMQFRMRSVNNGLAAFHAGFPLAANVVIYAVALPLMAGGAATLRTGDFMAFMTSFGTCLSGMLTACTALMGALAVVPLYEQALPILQARPEVSEARTDPGELSGDIEVQHLSFRYGTDGPLAVRDVSLRIRAGEYVAFVGPSGSGKSTLLRLLLGFEAPESGAIYYDGQELAGLDIEAVRRQIGVVLQNGRLMSGDLFTNIAGSSSATIEDAWEAARMAGFDEDVKGMPMGMHTVVSEGGGTLSGGQRQRLMIARAIVQRPRVLFFDEATSALDNRTQALVSASLDRLRATRVVIAHRLSTIVNADRIYVVQGGRIVQQGGYQELLEQEGLFRDLAQRQLA